MSKHTPGPWVVFHAGKRIGVQSQQAGHYHDVAHCDSPEGVFDTTKSKAEWLANARLIAAAPELLEACEQALKFGLDIPATPAALTEKARIYQLMVDAIAKAKGETK